MHRIGLLGSGFIAQGIYRLLRSNPAFEVTRVLTRRPPETVDGFPQDLLCNDSRELVEHADIIVECTGDAIFGTEALLPASEAKLPIVTVDSELQITTGSWFARRGYITEADGDQPGCLARLHQEAVLMGMRPLAYMNIKGFLNLDPSREDMSYWGEKQNLRLHMVTSFTDGTKLQIEQALVANGLGADIACQGMLGGRVEALEQTDRFCEAALEAGQPISDYVLKSGGPPGVFLLCDCEEVRSNPGFTPFAGISTESGRFSLVVRPYHNCYLEVARTLLDVVNGAPPLLTNSTEPRIGVAALPKRDLAAGTEIPFAVGSFDFRGEAVRIAEQPTHVPITLLRHAVLRRSVEAGQMIDFDDVDLPESRALSIYKEILASPRVNA